MKRKCENCRLYVFDECTYGDSPYAKECKDNSFIYHVPTPLLKDETKKETLKKSCKQQPYHTERYKRKVKRTKKWRKLS